MPNEGMEGKLGSVKYNQGQVGNGILPSNISFRCTFHPCQHFTCSFFQCKFKRRFTYIKNEFNNYLGLVFTATLQYMYQRRNLSVPGVLGHGHFHMIRHSFYSPFLFTSCIRRSNPKDKSRSQNLGKPA